MEHKIKFKDLSIWLKISVVLSLGIGGLFLISVIIDFLIILLGLY